MTDRDKANAWLVGWLLASTPTATLREVQKAMHRREAIPEFTVIAHAIIDDEMNRRRTPADDHDTPTDDQA